MAAYYSVELAQKITRGMQINSQKCLSNGSNPGLGYRVNKDRTFSVDEEEAPGGMPRIIDDALFERVQQILEANKKAPGRSKGRLEYLLTTKLFCGHCKEMMTGYGGTSKTGTKYHYYKCNGAKKGSCTKATVGKEEIEDAVFAACLNLFTEDRIKFIADEIFRACQEDGDLLSIKRIKTAIEEAEKAIENLWNALEQGQSVQKITERINKREEEKSNWKSNSLLSSGRKSAILIWKSLPIWTT